MPVKKQVLKSRPVCKTTFRLPEEAAEDAGTVHLAGDFNDWSETATPMKRLKGGDFTVTLELETGREYAYRYLLDSKRWRNDPESEALRPSPAYPGVENSVVFCGI